MLSWRDRAACRGVDLAVFYSTGGYGCHKRALELCGQCEVRRDCLEHALATEDVERSHRFGIRGGMTPGQRDALVRKRWAVEALFSTPNPHGSTSRRSQAAARTIDA